ncbi:hypothetical protein BM1_03350 [Bipolaris maydis]|nr:hypothetical protein BM1_03350 [Bipolaris maydis]
MTVDSRETTWDPNRKNGHRGAWSRDVPSRQDGAISDGRAPRRIPHGAVQIISLALTWIEPREVSAPNPV